MRLTAGAHTMHKAQAMRIGVSVGMSYMRRMNELPIDMLVGCIDTMIAPIANDIWVLVKRLKMIYMFNSNAKAFLIVPTAVVLVLNAATAILLLW